MLETDMLARAGNLDAPADDAAPVTPSDTTVIQLTRGLYIGGTGDVTVTMAARGNDVTYSGVPAGAILPIRVTRVKATATTATSIVAMW
jgi:hypothetical protein